AARAPTSKPGSRRRPAFAAAAARASLTGKSRTRRVAGHAPGGALPPRARGSAVEDERALQSVVAAEVEVDAELVDLRAVPRALAHDTRRAGHGGEPRVGEGGRVARRALVGLELGIAGAAYLQRPLPAVHVELDRDLLHRDDFADQLGQVGDRAAQLAGVHAQD